LRQDSHTTASRIFRFAIANKLGVKEDPTKLMESEKLSSGEQVSPMEKTPEDSATKLPVPSRSKLLHKVTEKEVLTPQETKALILATTPGATGWLFSPPSLPEQGLASCWRFAGRT